MRLFLAGLAALLLAGCETTLQQTPPGPMNYRTGYMHGCDSGLAEAHHPYVAAKRDFNSYQSDALYKQGFDEGRGACFADYNRRR